MKFLFKRPSLRPVKSGLIVKQSYKRDPITSTLKLLIGIKNTISFSFWNL